MEHTLHPLRLSGLTRLEGHDPIIPRALWFEAMAEEGGLDYSFRAGTLAPFAYLTADFLLDGDELAVFVLELREGESGPTFRFSFGLLNQCQARMRLPLGAVDQNRWLYEREGAWLKPSCWGDRVDLARVDRMRFMVLRRGFRPVLFGFSPITCVTEEPPRLEQPILAKGPLLDELGQSTLRDWPGKSRDSREVTTRLRAQLVASVHQSLPGGLSRWGGAESGRHEASGFFRVQRDDGRWWLLDPNGYRFWSAGVDCVRVDTGANWGGLSAALSWLPDQGGEFAGAFAEHGPEPSINYLAANLIRAFGPEEWRSRWAEIALAELRRIGFNTVGNWSEWRVASAARFPYVRPLEPALRRAPAVYRDFPDVYHPGFALDAAEYAEQLRETRDDPALIGYFMMNEPTWGFADESPAAGMLFTSPPCHCRSALAGYLRERHGSDAALAAAWSMPVSFGAVARGAWHSPFTARARQDLADFSALMVEHLFGALSEACRAVDPHHLNLGVRYYTVPPAWALEGMRHFDVFSMNCYRRRLPVEEMERASALLDMPIMIGEWHFGALDAGLPASGIGRVPDQGGRGKAYRVYLEDAAARPWCVGVHYFTLYDQSALGRFDGENYNIGFLDVCNRPYEELCRAARASHERLYGVAGGELEPYGEEPEYLPALYL